MRQIHLSLLIFIFLYANGAQLEYNFNYNLEDYRLTTDNNGVTTIIGQSNTSYIENDEPCLPITSQTLALPYGTTYENISYEEKLSHNSINYYYHAAIMQSRCGQ